MKHRAKEKYLNETAIALLIDVGIISSLITGLNESFGHLPDQPHSLQVIDITERQQDRTIKINYKFSLNGTKLSICQPVTAGIWLSGEGPITLEQMSVLKSLARPIDS